MAEERLRLTAEMRDRLSPALRRLKTVMESTGRIDAFRKLAKDMSFTERAAYRLAFGLHRGVAIGAKAAAIGIAGMAATALAAGAGMVKVGKDAVDSLDDLKAFSGQVGFSADSLRILQGVADRFNVDQEELRAGLQKFNVVFGQLKSGQGNFLGFLQKTNPALAAQMRHVGSTQEAYLLLFDAMSKISDPAKRAALAKAAGIGQQSLRFLADGPDGLRTNIKEIRELLGILGPEAYDAADNFNDAMGDVGIALRGLSAKMAVSVLPLLTPMLQDLSKWIAGNRERIANGFASMVADIAKPLQQLFQWLGSKDGQESLAKFWNDVKGIASAIAEVAVAVNAVVQSFGGWKVVIGSILALKAARAMKDWLSPLSGLAEKQDGSKPSVIPQPAKQAAIAGFQIWDLLNGVLGDPTKMSEALKQGKERSDSWNAALEAVIPRWLYNPDAWAGILTPTPAQRPLGNSDPLREQTLRNSLAELQQRLAKMDEEYQQWLKTGHDKSEPDRFLDFLKRRTALRRQITGVTDELTRILQDKAKSFGRKIGEEAGDSLYKRMMLLLGIGGGIGGGPGSGGGLIQAAYRTTEPALQATRAAFSRTPGAVPPNMTAGADRAMRLLMGSGLSPAQAAALAGNLQQESSFNPNALNRKEGAHGIMQWRGGRWDNLKSFAAGRGLNPNDFEAQIAFIIHELRTKPGLNRGQRAAAVAFLRAGNIEQANRALHGFISYGDGTEPVRRNNGLSILKRHQQQQQAPVQPSRIEGSASVDIRFPNGMPAGTRVGATSKGLFREVNLDTGLTLQPIIG